MNVEVEVFSAVVGLGILSWTYDGFLFFEI